MTPPLTLVEEGQAVYELQLKAMLESEHSGAFVAIEPSTGRYFLGKTATAALVAAQLNAEKPFLSHARRQNLSTQNRRPRLSSPSVGHH